VGLLDNARDVRNLSLPEDVGAALLAPESAGAFLASERARRFEPPELAPELHSMDSEPPAALRGGGVGVVADEPISSSRNAARSVDREARAGTGRAAGAGAQRAGSGSSAATPARGAAATSTACVETWANAA